MTILLTSVKWSIPLFPSVCHNTLGNYEKDENVDMSLGNLLTLADFYHVSTDYLLCRTELREHTNKSVSDLHLNDDAVQILTDEKYNPRLLSELLSHENFHKFMTDLEIYIDGFNDKGIQIANAFLDVMRCKLNELGADSTDAFTKISLMVLLLQLSLLQRILPKPLMMLILTDYSFCSAKIWK